MIQKATKNNVPGSVFIVAVVFFLFRLEHSSRCHQAGKNTRSRKIILLTKLRKSYDSIYCNSIYKTNDTRKHLYLELLGEERSILHFGCCWLLIEWEVRIKNDIYIYATYWSGYFDESSIEVSRCQGRKMFIDDLATLEISVKEMSYDERSFGYYF